MIRISYIAEFDQFGSLQSLLFIIIINFITGTMSKCSTPIKTLINKASNKSAKKFSNSKQQSKLQQNHKFHSFKQTNSIITSQVFKQINQRINKQIQLNPTTKKNLACSHCLIKGKSTFANQDTKLVQSNLVLQSNYQQRRCKLHHKNIDQAVKQNETVYKHRFPKHNLQKFKMSEIMVLPIVRSDKKIQIVKTQQIIDCNVLEEKLIKIKQNLNQLLKFESLTSTANSKNIQQILHQSQNIIGNIKIKIFQTKNKIQIDENMIDTNQKSEVQKFSIPLKQNTDSETSEAAKQWIDYFYNILQTREIRIQEQSLQEKFNIYINGMEIKFLQFANQYYRLKNFEANQLQENLKSQNLDENQSFKDIKLNYVQDYYRYLLIQAKTIEATIS